MFLQSGTVLVETGLAEGLSFSCIVVMTEYLFHFSEDLIVFVTHFASRRRHDSDCFVVTVKVSDFETIVGIDESAIVWY